MVETDRKPDVEVRVVRGIEAGYIIVRYGIRYFALWNLHNKVFNRDAVIADLMDMDAATQLLVQVDKPFIILSGFYVHILSDKFRYIFQRFDAAACTLYDDLMGNHLLTAVCQTVFPFFGDGRL